MVGGNLRQAGGLAAAGLVGLAEMRDRLPDDHRTAKRLAEGLAAIDPSLCDAAGVDTNIVQVDTRGSGRTAKEWIARLDGLGVRAGAWDTWRLRCVTHRHVGMADADRSVAAFRTVWAEAQPKAA